MTGPQRHIVVGVFSPPLKAFQRRQDPKIKDHFHNWEMLVFGMDAFGNFYVADTVLGQASEYRWMNPEEAKLVVVTK